MFDLPPLRQERIVCDHGGTEILGRDAALQSPKRGPKPDPVKAVERQLARLQQENEKLRKQLGRAEKVIDVQKGFAIC